MKVEVDGKMYCVETLIADNERLRKEVVASAELHRLILDSLRAEIEQTAIDYDKFDDYRRVRGLWIALDIIDKYKAEVEPQERSEE